MATVLPRDRDAGRTPAPIPVLVAADDAVSDDAGIDCSCCIINRNVTKNRAQVGGVSLRILMNHDLVTICMRVCDFTNIVQFE